jgi:hypothetical protein
MDPDAELVSCHSLKGHLVRSDVLEHVSEAELEGPPLRTSSLPPTHQRRLRGVWQRGHTVAYCDKMIRIAWPNLPYTRPCVRCAGDQTVNDFCRSAVNKEGFVQLRCRVPCLWQRGQGGVWEAKRERVARARRSATPVERSSQSVVLWARKTCTSCRNTRNAERNVVKAARTKPASVLGVCSRQAACGL